MYARSVCAIAVCLGTAGLTYSQKSPYYEFRLVASAASGPFSSFGAGPSVNHTGTVAFVGRKMLANGSSDNIYTWNPRTGAITQLMNNAFVLPNSGSAPTQQFANAIHISNDDQVQAWRRLDALVQIPCLSGAIQTIPLTYLESWPANVTSSSAQQIVMGDARLRFTFQSPLTIPCFLNPITTMSLPSPFDTNAPFDAIYASTSTSNNGKSAIAALLDGTNYRATGKHSGIPWLGGPTPNLQITPRIADTGDYVFSTGTTGATIYVEKFDYSGLHALAGPNYFSAVSKVPGISDDGQVIAFHGVLNATGAAALNVTAGPAAGGPT